MNTIKEHDFDPKFAQVRPELIELADKLLTLGGVQENEYFAFCKLGLIYRNQGWRECLITNRLAFDRTKMEYLTYQMPNGKVYKMAFNMTAELVTKNPTLRLTTINLSNYITTDIFEK